MRRPCSVSERRWKTILAVNSANKVSDEYNDPEVSILEQCREEIPHECLLVGSRAMGHGWEQG